jgi:hypothetical protein
MRARVLQDESASYLKSNFYEQLVEHAFISELLQEAWFRYGKTVEVLRSEIDSSGYDLLLECNGVIRHVQLKNSIAGAKTAYQKINIALAEKPSGCVVWLMREEDESNNRVNLKYHYFGDAPGKPLPSLEAFKIAKHTKGNAQGVKKERPLIRQVPKSKFIELSGINDLLGKLLGLIES